MSEYIDRDAFMPDIFCAGISCQDCPFLAQPINGGCRLRVFISSIPAADVRPVVHGKWVGNKRHQSCSECHMTYCVPDGQDGELDMTAYHFCPNCGADMRGDDDGT